MQGVLSTLHPSAQRIPITLYLSVGNCEENLVTDFIFGKMGYIPALVVRYRVIVNPGVSRKTARGTKFQCRVFVAF